MHSWQMFLYSNLTFSMKIQNGRHFPDRFNMYDLCVD